MRELISFLFLGFMASAYGYSQIDGQALNNHNRLISINDFENCVPNERVPGGVLRFIAQTRASDPWLIDDLVDPQERSYDEQRHRNLVKLTEVLLDNSLTAYALNPTIMQLLINSVKLANQKTLGVLSRLILKKFSDNLPTPYTERWFVYDLFHVVKEVLIKANDRNLRMIGVSYYRSWKQNHFASIFADAILEDNADLREESLENEIEDFFERVQNENVGVILLRLTLCSGDFQ